MDPVRWRQVEDLFHAALELAPGERERLLAESCGADEELRREVASLLASAATGADLTSIVAHAAGDVTGQAWDTLGTEREDLGYRQRSSAQPVVERLALEVLHDQVVDPLLGADVVDRADVRVVELRERPGFPLEALAELRVLGQVRRKDLDRDVAAEAGVPSFVHLAHAAPAER